MSFHGSFYSKAVIVMILIVLCLSNLFSGGFKNYGMVFLTIPVSSSSISTMSVFSPYSGNPGAVFEHPAGLKTDMKNFSFTHLFWFADVSANNLCISFPWNESSFGLGLVSFRIPGIEIRQKATDDPDGIVEASYISVAGGFARKILNRFTFGISIKYIDEIMYDYRKNGISGDAGIRTDIPGDMILSVLLQNITFYAKNSFDATYLPRLLKIGIIRPELFVGYPVVVSGGINLITELNSQISGFQSAVKINLYDKFVASTGMEQSGNNSKYSFGLGINLRKFGFYYSIILLPEELGNTKALTIDIYPDQIF